MEADYRRDYRGGPVDYLRGEGAVLLPNAEPTDGRLLNSSVGLSDQQHRQAPLGPRVLPRLWLAFLPLYWFPQRINWGLIGTYLIPFQVAAIVGDKNKHVAYSLTVVASNIGSIQGPIWGALSDKSIASDGRRRRRPFVIMGQLLFSVACFFLMTSKTFWAFELSYMLWTFTATLSGAPYTAIYTESICTEQRGFFNAVQQWQTLFVSFGISALGVLLGEHIISNDIAYWIAIALALFPTIPLGLVGLGESPGCWAPEPFAPLSSAAEEERRQQRDDRCCKRASATASDFVSAFRYPPFRWLFVCNVFNQCYGQISNIFFIYWFQDEVGKHGFSLLGRHITNSPQTALAFTTTIGTVCGFVLTLPGGWIADRWVDDRATILLVSSLVQTSCPLINAFLPTFTWVCFTSLISALVNGLAGAASVSILADCVPVAASGVPLAPARDYGMMAYSGIVPSIVLPGILGAIFSMFKSREMAYKAFFLIASGIHVFSSFLYLKVGQAQKVERAKRQTGRGAGNGLDEARQNYTRRLAATRTEDYRRATQRPLLGAE